MDERLRALLAMLADGEFHSGEALGARLGISRSAVWKLLRKLDALAVECYSIPGRGYRLPEGLKLLEEQSIRQHLQADVSAQLSAMDIRLQVDSTNRLALQGIGSGRHQGMLYLAESQTAGRGRRGRHWHSPFARNLYFSLVWSFTGGAAALEGLSLAVGVALVRALENMGVEGVQLKWPNDVQFQGRKLAGILLEMSGDAAGLCHVVVGVGVNVAMPAATESDIDQPWTDVGQLLGRAPDRNQLLAAVLNELLPLLSDYAELGLVHYLSEWQARDALAGRQVTVLTAEATCSGTVSGINRQGALVLDTAAGSRLFYAGEVSLRAE